MDSFAFQFNTCASCASLPGLVITCNFIQIPLVLLVTATLAATAPIVQEGSALRIVLTSPLVGSEGFACLVLAFLQDFLNDFIIYMCAKHVVEFLL